MLYIGIVIYLQLIKNDQNVYIDDDSTIVNLYGDTRTTILQRI